MSAKRILALIAALLVALSLPLNALAERTIEEYFAEMEFPHPIDAFNAVPYIGVYSAEGAELVFGKGENEIIMPASLTKLVTASVVLSYVRTDEVFTVGSELRLVKYDSSRCGIKKGQTLTVGDLLCGLLMRSGNDAAYTLAVNVARRVSGEKLKDREAVEYFCGLMNGLCQRIGAVNSNFATPDGYDADGQHTTVSDLALITEHAMNYGIISNITSCAYTEKTDADGNIFHWRNTNFFLNPSFPLYDPAICGVKTGSTDGAGKCLITRLTHNGKCYYVIVSGCADEGERYMSTACTVMQLFMAGNMRTITYGALGIVS